MKSIALILAVVVCSAVASDSYRRPIPFPVPSKGFKPSCRVQAICRRFCEFGFARDEDGCVKGCQCNPRPCQTSEPLCDLFCLHGFAKDRNGCYTGCACAPPPVVTVRPPFTIRPPTTKVCRDGPLCRRFCPHGYATDERGCTLPCTCNPAPTTPSPPTTRVCLDRMLCKKLCPFGPARDERGCVLPCTCNPRPVGRCPTLPPNSGGACVEACGLNGGCQPGFLCCSNGCGHTCQRAVVDTPNQKPGECPRLRSSFSSSSLSSKKSLRLSCQGDDFKCPGAQKCCSLRFNTDVCVNPISVTPTIQIGPRPY